MSQKYLDVQLNILWEGLSENSSLVELFECENLVLDTGFETSFISFPSDEECQSVDVGLSVEDISERIDFVVNPTRKLLLDYEIDTKCLDVEFEFKWPETRFPYYDGSYIVDSTYHEQILPTMEKSMAEDVIVNPISITYIENSAGGYTAVIGKE